MSESQHQAALFDWASRTQKTRPELAYLYAIPNGGLRSKATAARLKAEGTKAGVSDVHLPVPKAGFHGLWIELKNDKPKGRISPAQLEWLEGMRSQGHIAEVAYGWTEAKDMIEMYLAGWPCELG